MKLGELMKVCRCSIDLWNGENDKYLGGALQEYENWSVMNFTINGEGIDVVIRKEVADEKM